MRAVEAHSYDHTDARSLPLVLRAAYVDESDHLALVNERGGCQVVSRGQGVREAQERERERAGERENGSESESATERTRSVTRIQCFVFQDFALLFFVLI